MNAPQTQPAVYIVFSATQHKTGRLIRTILHTPYNHVSLSLTPSMECMYSFARRYHSAPFPGGFVTESYRRFLYRSRGANVKIYRIPLTEPQHRRLQRYVLQMSRHSELYLYNLYSAMLTPFKQRVPIKGCYTCVEFVSDALGYAGVEGFSVGSFYSFSDVEERCRTYELQYQGPAGAYPARLRWGKDHFRLHPSALRMLHDATDEFTRLNERAGNSVSRAVRRKSIVLRRYRNRRIKS
jgi:hypothetical protein